MMQKRVIKDIQVKKKPAMDIKKPVASLGVKPKESFEIRRPANINPSPSPKNVQREPIVIKDEGFVKEKSQSYIPKNIPENITNTDFTPFEDQIYSYKPKKNISRKTRIISVLSVLGLIIFMILVYLITRTKITITPKISDIQVNESININSWVKPFKSTVMVIEESMAIADKEEDTKTALDQKIKDRIKYDMPVNYILVTGCRTGTYYETIENTDKTKSLKAKVTTLVIEEKSLRDYLTNTLKLKDQDIKEIFNLTCDLKTDVSKYSTGEKANNLSILISGKIKSEYIIDKEDVSKNILGKSKTTTNNFLSNRESILSYTIKSRPFGFIHVIPKNPNHLNIIVESSLSF